jgi:hypothetical protein
MVMADMHIPSERTTVAIIMSALGRQELWQYGDGHDGRGLLRPIMVCAQGPCVGVVFNNLPMAQYPILAQTGHGTKFDSTQYS